MPEGPAAAQTPEEIERLKKEEEKRHIERLFKHTYGHRVRYEEIDAQGVVGSASWLGLIQLARIEYLRHLGLLLEGGRTPVQVMVRHASIEYLAPARFDDVVILKTRISYMGNSSARFEYLADSSERVRYLVAETLVVCVDMANLRSIPWPAVFRERVREFEEDGLQIGQLIR
jgi:acyl-CoA thioester hydrolase